MVSAAGRRGFRSSSPSVEVVVRGVIEKGRGRDESRTREVRGRPCALAGYSEEDSGRTARGEAPSGHSEGTPESDVFEGDVISVSLHVMRREGQNSALLVTSDSLL